MPYIASTMSSSVTYAEYGNSDSGANHIVRKVHVKGGAHVANNKIIHDGRIHTPNGVVTSVSDDELDFLKKQPLFQTHEKNGFIKIMSSNTAPDKAAKDMEKKDSGAQNVDDDYKKGGKLYTEGMKTVS